MTIMPESLREKRRLRKIYGILRDWYGTENAIIEVTAHCPKPQPVGDFLDAVMARAVGPDQVWLEKSRACWPAVVGPQLAKHSSFALAQGAVAIAEVDHPAWMMELNRMRNVLLAKLNTALGESHFTELKFIPAGRS